MMERYNRIIDEYSKWYPEMYSHTVEVRPSGRYSILVILDDGSRMEYCSQGNTVRNVTQFYTRESDEELNEETWRKEFGRKLQRAISDKGLTQERLSDITGISRQMLTRYVRGKSTPSGYILSRLAEVLECDVRELTKFGYIDE